MKEVNVIENNKRKGYQYIFGYRLNGLPVYYNTKLDPEAIEVQVMGKQVIYYQRYIKKEKIAVNFLETEDINKTTIQPPLKVIADNYEKIAQNYLSHASDRNNVSKDKDISSEVLSSLNFLKLGYYDEPMREPNTLEPIWIMGFDPYIYYFDAYSGKLVYQSDM